MKFGIREVTDIVFRTKVDGQTVGASTYPKLTPVFVVNSAKMSSMENAVATVYAQGGRGNPRLLAWDGDRTATFKFEDALITNDGLSILTGSGVATGTSIWLRQSHAFTVNGVTTYATFSAPAVTGATYVSIKAGYPYSVNALDSTGDIITPGSIFILGATNYGALGSTVPPGQVGVTFARKGTALPYSLMGTSPAPADVFLLSIGSLANDAGVTSGGFGTTTSFGASSSAISKYVFNYYIESIGKQLQVEAGKFAGYYYIEANTLFRDLNGTDHPAQITIPKGKVKSNFTLTMSPTGDPSTFSFEIDALPDVTRFVTDKTVLYTLDILTGSTAEEIL